MQHQVHGNNEQVRFIMDCDELDGHFHSEMEVLYVLSGRMTIIDNNLHVPGRLCRRRASLADAVGGKGNLGILFPIRTRSGKPRIDLVERGGKG